ncbi:MAG: hypothetical protein C4527_03360 [Candidatus Omnitrophota bacterium]|jgi:hypothetical protein|nr:MAG: hypothetical protein C4527_03360 [Candidatus Omnitrophota bacterium]
MAVIQVRFHTDQSTIDPNFYENLNSIALRYGLRYKQESHSMMDESYQERQQRIADCIRKADALAKEIGPVPSDSTNDIRALRDNR